MLGFVCTSSPNCGWIKCYIWHCRAKTYPWLISNAPMASNCNKHVTNTDTSDTWPSFFCSIVHLQDHPSFHKGHTRCSASHIFICQGRTTIPSLGQATFQLLLRCGAGNACNGSGTPPLDVERMAGENDSKNEEGLKRGTNFALWWMHSYCLLLYASWCCLAVPSLWRELPSFCANKNKKLRNIINRNIHEKPFIEMMTESQING